MAVIALHTAAAKAYIFGSKWASWRCSTFNVRLSIYKNLNARLSNYKNLCYSVTALKTLYNNLSHFRITGTQVQQKQFDVYTCTRISTVKWNTLNYASSALLVFPSMFLHGDEFDLLRSTVTSSIAVSLSIAYDIYGNQRNERTPLIFQTNILCLEAAAKGSFNLPTWWKRWN